MRKILKLSNYDKFKCTADKCKFTCCEGWDINVDKDTYNMWKNKELTYIIKNIKSRECEGEKLYFIDKEIEESCPFLDKKGLCNIVKNHGEEYLSVACYSFPRIKNVFEDREELSLCFSCPEVVETQCIREEKVFGDGEILKGDTLEFKIRETLINIMQREKFSLEERIIIAFSMLLNILEDESFEEESLNLELERYRDEEYLKDLAITYSEVELNLGDSLEEVNYLFLDIIENYRRVPSLRNLLEDVFEIGENLKIKNLGNQWGEYKKAFTKYSRILENIMVSKIFSNCINSDIEDIIISFEMIVLEYLLVKHTLFLKYCTYENNVTVQNLKDYIVVFSRVIGNNSEAVEEFLLESFEGEILELGYLCFVTLI